VGGAVPVPGADLFLDAVSVSVVIVAEHDQVPIGNRARHGIRSVPEVVNYQVIGVCNATSLLLARSKIRPRHV
jgi:hypothetical protein